MKSFSSSVINKSGKKFAPKAPVRRAAPAPPPAPSRRASVASQASNTQTTQSVTHPPTTETAPSAHAIEPPIPSTIHTETSVAEPSVAQSTDPLPSKSATAIPIPRPKRKASISAVAPNVPDQISTPPQPTPLSQDTVTSIKPTPSSSIRNGPDTQREISAPIEGSQEPGDHDDRIAAVPSELHPSVETATEIRPSKRPRITPENATADEEREISPSHVLTPPPTQIPTIEEPTEVPAENESQAAANQSRKPSKSKNRRPSKAANGESSTAKVRKKPQRSRKKREPTPEGAELIEIAPAVVKMSELCKDLRTGKKSKRETELRNMEIAEQERKQRAQQEEASHEQTPIKQNTNAASPEADIDGVLDKKPQVGPVMRIVNGEIVLDAASLQVDRHADAARNVGELEDVVESSLTRKINQATYGKRSKTESWDEEMTDLFYRGLRMFGTDFMMISKMFPGRSRRQIKLKFNNEERRDPGRINDTLLGLRETIDITTYSEMTNTVYDDPRVIQQELDEEKKRIEEQHAKEKQAQEELLHNPDGAADGNSASVPDQGNGVAVKGKRNSKKNILKSMGGGTEEIIGTIDDFP